MKVFYTHNLLLSTIILYYKWGKLDHYFVGKHGGGARDYVVRVKKG